MESDRPLRPTQPPTPNHVARTAFLLSRISGIHAAPVYDNGAWAFSFTLSLEDAAAIIHAADNPGNLQRLLTPLLERYREAVR